MASIESEVLDPAIARFRKAASDLALSRRSFLIAGAAGAAAAGAGLLSAPSAIAQEPLHNGYSQLDVLNLLLQVKYVTATLYSFITQGADLPPSSGATVGSAAVYNQPAKISFTTQQITDLFNEMYYDELSHVVDLRNLIESASSGQPAGGTGVVGRAVLNLLGNSTPATTPPATTTMTQSQAIAYARLLEDLSVSAAAGAAVYLSGTNLAYVTQMMSADGFHAGAVRLVAIQNNAQVQASGYQYLGVTTSAETAVTFSTLLSSTSATAYAIPASSVVVPSIGNAVSGANIAQGTAIKSIAGSVVFTAAISAASNTISGLTSNTGLAVGQYIVAYDSTSGNSLLPAGTTITNVTASSPYTLTLSNASSAASSAASVSVLTPVSGVTGTTTSGSNQVTALTSVVGLIPGLPITGTGIPAGATISAVNTTASSLTLSANATASGTKVALTVYNMQVVLTKTPLASGVQTVSVIQPDPMDLQPADNGSNSSKGPAAVSGASPAVYQGFFNTAGSGNTGATGTPVGMAFARNFSQVLQVLLNTNSTNTLVTNQSSEGGFYPYGVSGTINSIQPS